MNTSTCRGCGAEIEWWKSPKTGKNIPLDINPRLMVPNKTHGTEWAYRGDEHIKGNFADVDGPTTVLVRVSHFRTCPNRDEFSGSKKRGSNP